MQQLQLQDHHMLFEVLRGKTIETISIKIKINKNIALH
jgi:hypothetical protein